ncbi:MAG: hypothetical protein ACERKV_03260 [Clostridiaceae bacterium]
MVNKRKIILMFLIIFISITFVGCSSMDKIKVKLNLKNTDFELIKDGKIDKIIIQNSRDKGFTFSVTDKDAISDFYEIFSDAKVVEEKTELNPDYKIEMYDGANIVYEFSYIAGLDKKNLGNLYNDDKVYIVSDRLDDDIIAHFWTINKPSNFSELYYKSILETLEMYTRDEDSYSSVSININNDVGILKYILSTELDGFETKLKKQNNKAILIKDINSEDNSDVRVIIDTLGYKTDLYKNKITFYNKTTKNEVVYYIKYVLDGKTGVWNENIYLEKDLPQDF